MANQTIFLFVVQCASVLNVWHSVDLKEILFMWVLEHVGIRGNGAADRAAEEAPNKEPTVHLVPFSDVKTLTPRYVHQVWQKEWDEAVIVSNKLH